MLYIVQIDICVNNFLALKNTTLLKKYSLYEPRFRTLVLAIKTWAKARGCGDPRNATLTSYAWTLLVIFFLINHDEKILPPAFNVNVECEIDDLGNEKDSTMSTDLEKEDHSSVSQLFMEFFAFYGVCRTDDQGFSPFHHVLSIRNDGFFTGKRLEKMTTLYDRGSIDKNEQKDKVSNEKITTEEVKADDIVVKMEEVNIGTEKIEESSAHLPSPLPSPPLTDKKEDSSKATVLNSNAPSWRFSIEDPYEEHDLGRVVYSDVGQIHMMSEIRRVLDLFLQYIQPTQESSNLDVSTSSDFWSVLCTTNTSIPKAVMKCMVCGQDGHFSRDCKIVPTCSLCNEPGHFARDCSNMKCYKCFQLGHFSRNCPVKEKLCKFCRRPGHVKADCPFSHKNRRHANNTKFNDNMKKAEQSNRTIVEGGPVQGSPSQKIVEKHAQKHPRKENISKSEDKGHNNERKPHKSRFNKKDAKPSVKDPRNENASLESSEREQQPSQGKGAGREKPKPKKKGRTVTEVKVDVPPPPPRHSNSKSQKKRGNKGARDGGKRDDEGAGK